MLEFFDFVEFRDGIFKVNLIICTGTAVNFLSVFAEDQPKK